MVAPTSTTADAMKAPVSTNNASVLATSKKPNIAQATPVTATKPFTAQKPLPMATKPKTTIPANTQVMNSTTVPSMKQDPVKKSMGVKPSKTLKNSHNMADVKSKPRKKSGPENEVKASTGRWTEEEHRLFLIGLEQFPYRAWKKIATLIQTRTVVQIRTHAQKYYQKLAKENEQRQLMAESQNGPSGPGTDASGNMGAAGASKMSRGKNAVQRNRKRKNDGPTNNRKQRKPLTEKIRQDARKRQATITGVAPKKLVTSGLNKPLAGKLPMKVDCALNMPVSALNDNADNADDQFQVLVSLDELQAGAMDTDHSPRCTEDINFLRLSPSIPDVPDLTDDASLEWFTGASDANGPLAHVSASLATESVEAVSTPDVFTAKPGTMSPIDDMTFPSFYDGMPKTATLGPIEGDDLYALDDATSTDSMVLDPSDFITDFFTTSNSKTVN